MDYCWYGQLKFHWRRTSPFLKNQTSLGIDSLTVAKVNRNLYSRTTLATTKLLSSTVCHSLKHRSYSCSESVELCTWPSHSHWPCCSWILHRLCPADFQSVWRCFPWGITRWSSSLAPSSNSCSIFHRSSDYDWSQACPAHLPIGLVTRYSLRPFASSSEVGGLGLRLVHLLVWMAAFYGCPVGLRHVSLCCAFRRVRTHTTFEWWCREGWPRQPLSFCHTWCRLVCQADFPGYFWGHL